VIDPADVSPAVVSFVDEAKGAEESQNDANFVDAVFGDVTDALTEVTQNEYRDDFAPWHHPVKQIVRDYQWGTAVKKLLEDHRDAENRGVLRYFTLPGADLLDVRVLGDTLEGTGTAIEYFGFDTGYDASGGSAGADATGAYLAAESALRQAGRITGKAEILKDRLEDIAIDRSHAAGRLKQRDVFDVINIDACNHLGYLPEGRDKSLFDAMHTLLVHQLRSTRPWLLFLTTRANVQFLGGPTTELQGAIHKNLDAHGGDFGPVLADCIGGKMGTLAADMNGSWSNQNDNFLKLFCVGIGKYLLQFFHAQISIPSRVEMLSAYSYKVSGADPDMLSIAFRIMPGEVRVQRPSTGGAVAVPTLELADALALVGRVKKLWNLDDAIAAQASVKSDAVEGTRKLLQSANFDIVKWAQWLRDHKIRPLEVDQAA
jgi:hypothetical protein